MNNPMVQGPSRQPRKHERDEACGKASTDQSKISSLVILDRSALCTRPYKKVQSDT